MAASFLHSRLDLACEPSAVRFGQSHAANALTQWEMADEVSFDSIAVVAELVSNAVGHARCPSVLFDPVQGRLSVVRRCALTLWVTNTRLHVGVSDQSVQPPVLRPFSPDEASSGRGIMLVAGLSEGLWGSASTKDGKVVWAALPLPAAYRRRLARICSLSQGLNAAVNS